MPKNTAVLSTIAEELEKIAKLKPVKKEARQAYLKRLIDTIAEVPEAAWNALSKPAQEWNNANCERADANQELLDFPEPEAPPVRRTPKVAEGVAEPVAAAPKKRGPKPKAAKKEKAAKKAAAKPAKVKAEAKTKANGKTKVVVKLGKTDKAKKARKPRGESQSGAIRDLVFDKPNISEDAIMKKLKPKFPSITLGTIGTVRATTRAVMKHFKPELFA